MIGSVGHREPTHWHPVWPQDLPWPVTVPRWMELCGRAQGIRIEAANPPPRTLPRRRAQSASAILAGAGLTRTATLRIEPGGQNLLFGEVGHFDSPSCPGS